MGLQHDLRKIPMINQQIIPPKPMNNPGRGPPPAISPVNSQTQHAILQDRMQGPSQARVYSPPPAISLGPSQTQHTLPEDRMQPTPSPSTYGTNESVLTCYSNYFEDDYE
ncbi:unnamed protein product [Parnassius apollo]|uniref:(apollo) hypothetical protein n=1 Tax=Parnassius apollo TaxID=110799 RepID=A0A8S3XA16_PARAO|nr:unnamed protein product [Parnassius apollo]